MGAADSKTLPQSLRIKQKNGIYYFFGELNEYADLSELVSAPSPIIINFGEVHRINSIGIRNLMRFVSLTSDKIVQYHDCPVALISQINMIPALLGKNGDAKRVCSFYIPYFCEDCHLDFEVRKSYEEVVNLLKSEAEMSMPCPHCQKQTKMELDDYFIFLTDAVK